MTNPFLFLVSTVLALSNSVSAGEQVVPNSLATVEGNSENAYPFGIWITPIATQRYQQVYDASEFTTQGVPLLITGISFRPDARFGRAFSYTIPNVQINLSTTLSAPDGLSLTFAANVGSDDSIVFSGPLSLSSAFTGPSSGSKDFDIQITLEEPFLYDPSVGSLLLDVRRFTPPSASSQTYFDSYEEPGDSISRVYTAEGTPNGVDLPTAAYADTQGLVTMFTFSQIPEPTTVSFLAFGALAWVMVRRKR